MFDFKDFLKSFSIKNNKQYLNANYLGINKKND